jgi:protein-tyrosine-phosphatase
MLHDLEDLSLDASLAVRAARERLDEEFAGAVGHETVDAILQASWNHIDAAARLKHHVPLLAERFARGQLWALARMAGHHDGVPAVLFLDTHDAGRAAMASGLLAKQAGSAVMTLSAGTDPDIDVPPAVLEVMHEADVSLEQAFPKPYTPEMLRVCDLVVTFGDGQRVPLPDGTPHEEWDLPDPRGMSTQDVRAVRDRLAALVTALLARLPAAAPSAH